MKKRKILKSLIALSCCMTMGLSILTGCGESPCEHVYTVVDTVESTCTTAGRQTFSCGLCGDIKEEDLPINENAHVFTGEWDVTEPTEQADGLAVKTCVNNPLHKAEVTLPKVTITGSGYDEKEFITVPTTAREGEIKLTLKNGYGDITFNVPLAKRKLDNLEDAVVLASSLRENVRQSTGWIQETKDGSKQNFSYYFGGDYYVEDENEVGKYNYLEGDKYTYIKDDVNNTEYWYSFDEDGKVFAMSKPSSSSTASVVISPDENMIYGFNYKSSVNISTFYGAENGLARLYEIAKNSSAFGSTVKYEEISKDEINDAEHKGKDGSRNNLWFSYGYDSGSWFARFKVTFSIYPDGTLKNLEVQTEIIRGYMHAREEDKSAIYYKEGDASVVKHGAAVGDIVFGYEYPTDFSAEGAGGPAYEYDKYGNFVYEQTNKKTGNVVYYDGVDYYDVIGGSEKETVIDGKVIIDYITEKVKLDYVPELEDVYVKDVYGEYVLNSKGNKIKKIMAKGGYPVTKHYSDDHPEVNYKTVRFDQTKKVTQYELEEGLLENPEEVKLNRYPSDSLYIKDFDITAATVGGNKVDISDGLVFITNKVINLTLGEITPNTASLNSDAIANIYIKDVTGTLIKVNDISFNNGSKYKMIGFFTPSEGTVTIKSQYAGDLTLVFETQSGKCKKEFNFTFTKSAPTELYAEADVYTVTDGVAEDRQSTVNTTDKAVTLIVGQQLMFRARAKGEEVAYVSTDILPSVDKTGLEIRQSGEGNYEEWSLIPQAVGEYIVTLPYYDGTTSSTAVYAQFKVTVLPKLTPMEILSGNTFTGTVYIARTSGNPVRRTLTAQFTADGEIKISVAGNECVYTYGVNDSGELVTAYNSGVGPDVNSYNFRFHINNAGDLIITHSTGLGTNTEDIVLTKVVETDGQA